MMIDQRTFVQACILSISASAAINVLADDFGKLPIVGGNGDKTIRNFMESYYPHEKVNVYYSTDRDPNSAYGIEW